MTFSVKKHRLHLNGSPVDYAEAIAWDRKTAMKPTLVVTHDTAGHLTPGNCVDWFENPKCTVSAHFVVERDGSVTQMAPLNRRAYHAGKSSWKGRANCNDFAIGIEIVNPGRLDRKGRAWFHKPADKGFDMALLQTVGDTKGHKAGTWMAYTPAQIEAVKGIAQALCAAYPIEDIVTHWMISPGRKEDTNPLFPLESVRQAALDAKPKGEVVKFPAPESADTPVTPGPTVDERPARPVDDGGDTSLELPEVFDSLSALAKAGSRVAKVVRMIWAKVGATIGAGLAMIFGGDDAFVRDHAMAIVVVFLAVLVLMGFLVHRYVLTAARDGRYAPRRPPAAAGGSAGEV